MKMTHLSRRVDGREVDRVAQPNILILTGERGVGKTTRVLSLCRSWSNRDFPHFGVASPKIMDDGLVVGISAVDLASGETKTLALRDDEPGRRIGPWRFLDEGIAFANDCCRPREQDGVAVIDEIGPLELRGQGLTMAWGALQTGRYPHALIVVRTELVETVKEKVAGDVRIISWSEGIEKTTPEEMDRLVGSNFGSRA